jgi:hypothetical protein
MKLLSSTILAFMLATAISSVASARSLPAIAGHAYYPSDTSCFFPQATWAGVKNTCTTKRSLVIPLENTLTASGAITVKANSGFTCPGTGPCLSDPPKCTAYQVSAAGGLVTSGTATIGSGGNITIKSFASVAPTDTLHVVCEMPAAGPLALGLMSVNW